MGTEVALGVIFGAIAAPRWLWLFRIDGRFGDQTGIAHVALSAT